MRKEGAVYVVPHIYTAYLGAIPPLAGLTLTGVISLFKDFESVNRTHCKVPNVVPSISSCIGNATPQRYIWRASIALMLMVRAYSGLLYYGWFQVEHRMHSPVYRACNGFTLLLFYLQYAALATLTFVGSNENHDIHEASTIAFMVFSVLHQWMHMVMFVWSRPGPLTRSESFSLKWKAGAAFLNNAGAAAMIYLYERHNSHCEPYMYSYFATCEWIVVFTNILFHYSEVEDFKDMEVAFVPAPSREKAH